MVVSGNDLPLQRAFRWESERGDRPFLTQPLGAAVRDWTWAAAMDEARRVAAWLRAQPWEPGSRIAILSKNSAWWIMADLAVWMSGHVSVPIYPSLRPESVREILDHSGARACFVGAVEPETSAAAGQPGLVWIALPNAGAPLDFHWQALVEGNAPLGGFPTRPADDLATIIYTSGTTGTPKGVMHRFAAFAHDSAALTAMLGLDTPQRALSYLPLAHILERAGTEVISLRLGSHIFFTAGIDTFLDDLVRARPTIFLSVPRLLVKVQQGIFAHTPKEKLDRLLRLPGIRAYVKRRILRRLGLDHVRYAACGGAPMPPETLLWYRNIGLPLSEGYGMSETMITHLPKPDSVRPGCVGPAIEGVETRIGDDGELLIRSPMNLAGYYRAPELTAAAFTSDGFFRTGDRAAIDPDGQLRITGRLKEEFKTSKGKYVTPAPIESRLMEHPGIESCCVLGAGRPRPFAVIVLAAAVRAQCADPAGCASLENSLRAHLDAVNATLDHHERLCALVVADDAWTVANGLLTPTLKIRRAALEQRYRAALDDALHGLVWETPPIFETPRARAS